MRHLRQRNHEKEGYHHHKYNDDSSLFANILNDKDNNNGEMSSLEIATDQEDIFQDKFLEYVRVGNEEFNKDNVFASPRLVDVPTLTYKDKSGPQLSPDVAVAFGNLKTSLDANANAKVDTTSHESQELKLEPHFIDPLIQSSTPVSASPIAQQINLDKSNLKPRSSSASPARAPGQSHPFNTTTPTSTQHAALPLFLENTKEIAQFMAKYKKQVFALQDELSDLKFKLQSLKNENERTISVKEEQIAKAESENKDLSLENKNLLSKSQSLEEAVLSLKAEIQKVQLELHESSTENQSLNRKVSQFTIQIEERTAMEIVWNDKYKSLQNENTQLSKEISQVKIDKDTTQCKLEQVVTQNTQLELALARSKSSADADLTDKVQSIKRLQEKLNKEKNASARLTEIEQDILEKEKTVSTQGKLIEQLELDKKHLESQLKAKTAELCKAKNKTKSSESTEKSSKDKIWTPLVLNNVKALGKADFGVKYETLQMRLVDQLEKATAHNYIKNILAALEIPFTQLRSYMVFIRDDLLAFFREVHTAMHGDPHLSMELDCTDKGKMRQCMKLLIEEINSLKLPKN